MFTAPAVTIMRSTFAAGLLAAIVLSCSHSESHGGGAPPFIRNAKPGSGMVAVIGDSLANGTGATDENVKPTGCLANATGNPVKDLAEDGLTSAETIKQAEIAVNLQSKLVFVSAGGNDAIREYVKTGSYPVQQTLDDMTKVFDYLLESGALVVYLGLNPPTKGADRLPLISQLARDKGVIVVDGMAGLWEDQQKMHDGFHPNDAGYAIMCDRIKAAISGYYP